MKVRKRDGRVISFRKKKILTAVSKAALSVGVTKKKLLREVVERVLERVEELGKEVVSVEEIQDIVEEILMEKKLYKVAKAYILYRNRRAETRRLAASLGVKSDLKLNPNSLLVLSKRYLLKDEKGRIRESPKQLFRRVARTIARVEEKYGAGEKEIRTYREKFYKMMINKEFLANSPTLMNAGTPLGQLSACFVLPIEDSLESIFDTLKKTALIHQTGGGTGFNFSNLRPEGDVVRTTGGVACLTGDMLISTPQGLIPIKEIISGKVKEVNTIKGPRRVVNVYRNGVADVLKVTTENGIEIEATPYHKFPIVNSKGFGIKKLRDINSEDRLLMLLSESKMDGNWDDESKFWYLIGLFFAEGSWTHKRHHFINFTISSREEDLKERILEFGEVLGVRPRVYPRKELSRVDIRFNSKELLDNLGKRGLLKGYSKELRAPREVFSESKENIAAFLAGAFDGDGYFKRLSLKSASKGFLQDVQTLLTYLGIASSLKRSSRKNTSFRLEIVTSQMKERFRKTVGQFSLYSWKIPPSSKNRLFSYPFNVIRWIRDPHKRALVAKSIISYNNKVTHRKAIIRLRELECLGEEEKDLLEKMSLLYPVRISRVEYTGKKEVFNLEVEDEHYYVVHGIYSSNSGPVSFMRVFDAATQEIKQGGKRRGANMGILSVNHPDILNFITCKAEGGLTNFNISVMVTDDFMKAVSGGGSIKLVNPRTGVVVQEIKARALWDLMITEAWRTGDPGIIFYDEINRHNPTPKLGAIESTNPCGEVPLLPYESCNLGSINLVKMVVRNKRNKIDWKKLESTVRLAVRFLDNVIDANKYPIKEIEEMSKRTRKIGLGVMGWADLLLLLGIPYNSEKALSLARKVMRTITNVARDESLKIAEEKGSFLAFKDSVFPKQGFSRMRNATVTTVAPTGTISILAGCSSGIEPLFSIVTVRDLKKSLGATLVDVNPIFIETAIKEGFYTEDLVEKVARDWSIQGVEEVPREIRELFVTAHDISPTFHVRMQAAFQEFTDNAVSKTVNLPHNATPHEVERVYLLAWKLGCKGVTVFRTGCKGEQVFVCPTCG